MPRENLKMMMHEELKNLSSYEGLIKFANQQGYTLPNSTTLSALKIFLDYMDTQGYPDKAEVLGVYAYNDLNVRDFAKINIAYPNGLLFLEETLSTGTVNYNATGFKLSSVSSAAYGRINLRFAYSSATAFKYKQGNACRIHILGEVAYVNSLNDAIDGIPKFTGDNLLYNASTLPKITQGSGVPTGTAIDMTGTGLKAVTRGTSTTYYAVNKAVTTTLSRPTTASVIENPFCLGYANNAAGNQGYSFSFIGGYLTLTEIENIRTAFNTYLVNIGLTAFA